MSLLSRLAVQAARAYGMLVAGSANNVSADYLVVAGGGGAGDNLGGAGGAGGLLTSTATLSTLNTYSITVGAGGLGATSSGANGSNGSNSAISGTGLTTITSTGGGGGAGDGPSGGGTGTAQSGGSGGGGASASGNAGGAGTAGQGNNGGSSPAGTYRTAASGGGGAGTAGSGRSSTADNGGNGGNGTASSISGSSVTYAGGGGGGGASAAGTGGTGGGGNGKTGTNVAGDNGTVNLGGGGGGGSPSGGDGGSGGSGIVIISYTSATPKFVGGTITTSGGKQIHTFTSSGTLSPITPITASYLVVAGGGGGAQGGGGAGGLLTSSTTLYSGATYVVTVGAGGTGGPPTTTGSQTNGSDSIVSGTGLTTLTATGGGFGGRTGGGNGNTGGSGGGGAYATNGGAGTSGQGFAGGNGGGASSAGGGGGSSAVGSAGSGSTGGNGGAGTASSITGTSVTYAGGGGGAANTTAGSGGSGGGGSGGVSTTNGGAGTPNLGGGGGGGGATSSTGGNGGSGTVIISYAGSQAFNGGLVTTSGGNTIHTFTSTGALTPLTNNLNNSLRFRRSVTASLTRTPTVAGNRKTFTWSAWVKRGVLDSHQFLLSAATSTAFCAVDLLSNTMRVNFGNGTYLLVTTQVFRDTSAWYHIVLAVDTTQATDTNRVRLFVNGNQVTAFSTAVYPIQNYDTAYNNTVAQRIGVNDVSDSFDGYMADINFIDGQALEPYYFGNNDANGVWKPILYKGTYGTNGFYLNFADTSALTTSSNAGLGKDTSGNGNYWTTNNISITSGSTYDPMLDVPTNTSATVANYCVLNPLAKRRTVTQVATFSEANLKATFPNAAGNSTFAIGTFGVTSGKWYWEIPVVTRTTELVIGIGNTGTLDETNGGAGYQATNGAISGFTTNPPAGASYTSGDIIGVALDVDAGTCAFYKNNSLQGTGTGLLSTPQPWVQGNTNDVINANFGQRPFSYTPPSGFNRLNTYNLPDSTIKKGNSYMDATLYTGNGTSQTITTASSFKPDLVWIKGRSYADFHTWFDTVRGATKSISSDLTTAEVTRGTALTAFTSTGFTVGSDTLVNYNGQTTVAWQWQAGQGSTSSNTSGSITSTVSVNTTAGFSIVLYTGNGGAMTVGHGLGVAPKMIILKDRDIGRPWPVYHGSLATNQYLILNTTAAAATSTQYWNNTAPTSTVFSVNGIEGNVGANGEKYVAYCWAEIAGFSKFGSYTGNGSTDGPFIFLGFRPKFVMIKRTDGGTNNWVIFDSSRNTYNATGKELKANTSAAEYDGDTTNPNDFLSNGLKIRHDGTAMNISSGTYIYMAFAENPFKNALAR